MRDLVAPELPNAAYFSALLAYAKDPAALKALTIKQVTSVMDELKRRGGPRLGDNERYKLVLAKKVYQRAIDVLTFESAQAAMLALLDIQDLTSTPSEEKISTLTLSQLQELKNNCLDILRSARTYYSTLNTQEMSGVCDIERNIRELFKTTEKLVPILSLQKLLGCTGSAITAVGFANRLNVLKYTEFLELFELLNNGNLDQWIAANLGHSPSDALGFVKNHIENSPVVQEKKRQHFDEQKSNLKHGMEENQLIISSHTEVIKAFTFSLNVVLNNLTDKSISDFEDKFKKLCELAKSYVDYEIVKQQLAVLDKAASSFDDTRNLHLLYENRNASIKEKFRELLREGVGDVDFEVEKLEAIEQASNRMSHNIQTEIRNFLRSGPNKKKHHEDAEPSGCFDQLWRLIKQILNKFMRRSNGPGLFDRSARAGNHQSAQSNPNRGFPLS